MAALAVLPIAAAGHLPLLDAPGHIARLAELRRLLAGEASPFYRLDSFFLANLGFEALGLPLLAAIGPDMAGRIFLAFSQVLTLGGVVALNRVAIGRWSLAPLACGLVLYNLVTLLGFFSYGLGLALVLWALALSAVAGRSASGRAIGLAAGPLLVLCHAMAFLIYAAGRGGFLLADLRARRRRFSETVGAALDLLPGAALFVATAGGGDGVVRYSSDPVLAKLAGLGEALTSGSLAADLAGGIGLLAFLVLLASAVRVRLAAGFGMALVVLFALYLALPFELGSASNVDKRLPIALAFIALAGLDLRPRRPALAGLLGTLTAAGIVAKQAVLAAVWTSYDPPIDSAVAALRALPPGTVILRLECRPPVRNPADAFRKWQPPMTHLAALATLDGTRFAADNWAIPGQQPWRPQPPYDWFYRLQMSQQYAPCDGEDPLRIAELREAIAAHGEGPPVALFVIRPPPGSAVTLPGVDAALVPISPRPS